MSETDSSGDEDLSRFKDVVDTSFFKSSSKAEDKLGPEPKLRSERYLDIASHYNDVKVPDILQKKIGAKISAILDKSIQYVDVSTEKPKKRKIKGGVKLFSTSDGYMSCTEESDIYTEKHNVHSKKLKHEIKKRKLDTGVDTGSEIEKINCVVLNGEDILSRKETKCWKSRRKEKLYKYKTTNHGKLLVAIE